MNPFIPYQDMARLEYGRILWRNPAARNRLMRHWSDPRHPYAERFKDTYEPLVREVLENVSDLTDEELDRRFRARGTSLRAVAREIPPVFGSFW
jgi:hypothetical protein